LWLDPAGNATATTTWAVASYAITKNGEFGGRASSAGTAVLAGVVVGVLTPFVGPPVPVESASSLPLQPTIIAAHTNAAIIKVARFMIASLSRLPR
jgi:hypothetical protein